MGQGTEPIAGDLAYLWLDGRSVTVPSTESVKKVEDVATLPGRVGSDANVERVRANATQGRAVLEGVGRFDRAFGRNTAVTRGLAEGLGQLGRQGGGPVMYGGRPDPHGRRP